MTKKQKLGRGAVFDNGRVYQKTHDHSNRKKEIPCLRMKMFVVVLKRDCLLTIRGFAFAMSCCIKKHRRNLFSTSKVRLNNFILYTLNAASFNYHS